MGLGGYKNFKNNRKMSSTLKVCKDACDQCLFGKNKIVSEKRKIEILKDCIKNDTHFECHKGTIVGENIVCSGFFQKYSTNLIRIMGRLGAIEFINPNDVLKEKINNQRAKKNSPIIT